MWAAIWLSTWWLRETWWSVCRRRAAGRRSWRTWERAYGSSGSTWSSRDEAELAELVRRKQPEVIYHLAAQSNPQGSLTDPRGTWALNLGGSLNLLEAVKSSGQKPRVVMVGSGVCYGNPPLSSFRSTKIARCAPTIPMRRARPRSTCWGFSTTWRTAPMS